MKVVLLSYKIIVKCTFILYLICKTSLLFNIFPFYFHLLFDLILYIYIYFFLNRSLFFIIYLIFILICKVFTT